MAQEILAGNPSEVIDLGGKSWTAYIWLILLSFFIFLPIIGGVWSHSWLLGLVFLIVAVTFIAYQVQLNRSYNIYHDNVGVWVYSGILPWRKGIVGVKWRDLDDAVYFQTFWSWLFKSYSIRIGHRFTKSSEIFLTHMHRGHDTAMKINGRHHELVNAGLLT